MAGAMKRRPHAQLRAVYVRLAPELFSALEALRVRTADADGEYVSMGELARRLLAWAVRAYPESKTPSR